jgi:hypothetical protein
MLWNASIHVGVAGAVDGRNNRPRSFRCRTTLDGAEHFAFAAEQA